MITTGTINHPLAQAAEFASASNTQTLLGTATATATTSRGTLGESSRRTGAA